MSAAPLLVIEAIVSLDYGQFWLIGSYPDSDDGIDYLDAAITGDGIAGNDHGVVVISPHQNNFQMPWRLELWPDQPPDDLAEWQEVFRCGFLVDHDGLRYQSPDRRDHLFPVPAGSYAALISGRGFVNRGWPGSTTPGDTWRIQMWRSHDRPHAQRIKTWQPPSR